MDEEDDERRNSEGCLSCSCWPLCNYYARSWCDMTKRLLKSSLHSTWNCCKTNRVLVLALLLGQVLSLLLCAGGVSCEALEEFQGITAPTTQLFLSYFLLALVFGTVLACKEGFLSTLWKQWWKYAILGLIDAEANFLVVLAYKYTTFTSIQLLDSFTIVAVLVLSFVFLRVRYLILHLVAVALCMVGIIALVLADLEGLQSDNPDSNPLLGDLLCIIASVLYATSNVSQEYLVKNRSVFEWLALIGVSGSIVSGVQLSILERATLVRIDWADWNAGVLFSAFSISQFLFYSLVPLMLRLTSAVVLNLSLLTADIYSLAIGYFLFDNRFSLFYLVALVLIITGVFIFNLRAPLVAKPRKKRRRAGRSAEPREGDNVDGSEKETKQEHSNEWKKDSSQMSQAMKPIIKAATKVSTAVPVPKRPSVSSEEKQGILVRGPAEAAMSSNSYTVTYTESMSYGSTDASPKDADPAAIHNVKSVTKK